MTHDKISFIREYCKCRRIPYKIVNESLLIENQHIIYSVCNHSYAELVQIVDDNVYYNVFGFYDMVVIPF